MASKLSFSIMVSLMADQFKRGARQVRDSVRAIKAETVAFAAALGAGGLGLTELVGRFAEVARATSRAQTALKNVSGTTAQYADNLSFIASLAKAYGLEVNALTANYARFTATANVSGMSLVDQRKIFESLSRACAAFGLGADQTGYVFTALSQMMSKGKVSSEELRQQMGEQLPVALQAMAKAAGVSMGELEKLMQQGQLLSADVLPKFADALNELMPDVSTDNLEASINRLQNTFAGLVNSSGAQGFYKRVVELADSLLQHVRDGVTGLVAFVATMVGLKMLASVAGYAQKVNKTVAGTISAHQKAEEQKLLATEKRLQAEQRLQLAQAAFDNAADKNRLTAYDRLEKAKTALKRAEAAEQQAIESARLAQERAAALQSGNLWTRAASRVKLAMAGVAAAAKGMLASFGIGFLITGVSALVGYLVNVRKEAERVRNIFADYQKEIAKAGTDNQEISRLQALQELYRSANGDLATQQQYKKEIETLLGRQIEKEEDINDAIAKRIKLIESQARAELQAQAKIKAEQANRDLLAGAPISQGELESLLADRDISRNRYRARLAKYAGRGADVSAIDKLVTEYSQNLLIIGRASLELENAIKDGIINKKPASGTDDTGGSSSGQSELQKQQERYAQSLRELNARREVEKLSVDEYNKALDELNRSSLVAAQATGDREVLESQYLKTLRQAVGNPAYNAATAELSKVQAEYAETERQAKAKLDARLITEEQYRAALLEAASSAALAAVSIEGIGGAADEFVNRMKGVMDANTAAPDMPALRKRDATFDYRKSHTEIGREKLDIWVDYRDSLQGMKDDLVRSGKEASAQLEAELNAAIANIDSLEDALKLAEVQEDIEQLRGQLSEGIYGGIKDVASNADRLVSAFQNLSETMRDEDASAWERVLAVWNAMVQTVDGILSVVKTIENISGIVSKLSGAEDSSKAIIAGKVAELVATQAASAANIAAAKKETEAEVTKMAAKATAAFAGIPFAGIGLAAAQIAGMTALIAGASKAIPKFAGGGIVPGSSPSGDRLLARVNSGEMILNPAQQANLFRMLNTGRAGNAAGGSAGVVIGFDRVRGSDIYLALKNYKKSTGKTL